MDTNGREEGFNSCYHITDIPSLYSNDMSAVMMFDPRQAFFLRDNGKCLRSQTLLAQTSDRTELLETMLAPWVGFDWGHSGTVFRLPLRTERSDLCSTVLTPDAFISLFTDFAGSRGPEALLFLRHVRSVSFECIAQDGTVTPYGDHRIDVVASHNGAREITPYIHRGHMAGHVAPGFPCRLWTLLERCEHSFQTSEGRRRYSQRTNVNNQHVEEELKA